MTLEYKDKNTFFVTFGLYPFICSYWGVEHHTSSWLFGAYQHLSEMFVIEIGLDKDLHDPYADILFALSSHHHKASAYGQEFSSAFELDQQSFQLNIGRQQASLRGSTDGIASLQIYRR